MPFFAIDDVATQMALQCVAAPRGLSCPAHAGHPVITGDPVCSRPDPKADQRLLDCPPSRAMTPWDGDLADPHCLNDRCNCQIARAAKAPPPGSTGCRATHWPFPAVPHEESGPDATFCKLFVNKFCKDSRRRGTGPALPAPLDRRVYRSVVADVGPAPTPRRPDRRKTTVVGAVADAGADERAPAVEAVVPECKFVAGKAMAVPAGRTNPGDAPDPTGPREPRACHAAMTDARRARKTAVTTMAHAAVTAVPPMSPAAPGKRRQRRAGRDGCDCGHYDHQLAHDGDLLLGRSLSAHAALPVKSMLLCRALRSRRTRRARIAQVGDKQSRRDVQMTNATVSDKKVSFESPWL